MSEARFRRVRKYARYFSEAVCIYLGKCLPLCLKILLEQAGALELAHSPQLCEYK
jgi:hypothetical protein